MWKNSSQITCVLSKSYQFQLPEPDVAAPAPHFGTPSLRVNPVATPLVGVATGFTRKDTEPPFPVVDARAGLR